MRNNDSEQPTATITTDLQNGSNSDAESGGVLVLDSPVKPTGKKLRSSRNHDADFEEDITLVEAVARPRRTLRSKTRDKRCTEVKASASMTVTELRVKSTILFDWCENT